MSGFKMVIALVCLVVITLEAILAARAPKSHAGHAHSSPFGKINRPSKVFVSNKPRVKDLGIRTDEIVQTFKQNVLRLRSNTKLDLIFVIDASRSVKLENFIDEIRFVSRFVSGIPVSMDTTRVAVITFADNAQTWVDQVTADNIHDHKCSLLGTSLPAITYASGSTYTYGGLLQAKNIMDNARTDSKKVVLLITDGRSNSGDPRGVAERLRRQGIEIFTFGVHSGNVDELTNMASEPKNDHVYILESFAEFESVARRALHADAEGGDYIAEEDYHCDRYCTDQGTCCHSLGACRCGTTTGIYQCVCDAGYFGFGLLPDGCMPCPRSTYKTHASPGGPESCLPCPDINMISPNGSSSLDQCTCKRGYRKVDNRCDVIRCPVVPPPLNGGYEGLSCDNIYKSRCRVFCDEGYDLVGSERMVCGIDGSWGTPEGIRMDPPICQIRYCPEMSAPLRSFVNCSKEDWSYQTQCQFACEEGYAVVGSQIRYCQSNMEWDGMESNCEEIRCSEPNPPSGGDISANCKVGEDVTLPYGETCLMTCPGGFVLSVSTETTCIQINQWSINTASAKCIDIEPPSVVCPDNIVVTANPQLGATEVSWDVPTPVDNSDNVILTASPSLNPPASFHIGLSEVIYSAVDSGGLTAQCSFSVNVVDTEPPSIDRCSDPEPFVIARDETIARNVIWEEPTFSDNSGTVFVNRSRDFGDLPFGQTRIRYTASDATGNHRACVIVVSVQHDICPPLEDPKYGYKRCRINFENLVECELLCNNKRYGMAMQEYGTPYHTCAEDGEWQPPYDIPKDCSFQRYASEITKGFRVKYNLATSQTCDDTEFLKSVEIKFMEYFTPRISLWCQTPTTGIVCTLLGVIVDCIAEEPPTEPEVLEDIPIFGDDDTAYDEYVEGYYYEEEERRRRSIRDNHPRKQIHHRRKRQTPPRGDNGDGSPPEPNPPDSGGAYTRGEYDYTYGDDEYPNSDVPLEPPATEDLSFTDSVEVPDEVIQGLLGSDGEEMLYKLEITLNIHGQIALNDEDVESSRTMHGQMSEFFGQLNLKPEFTENIGSIPVRHINTSVIEFITYDADSYTSSLAELQCPIGAVLRESATCVNCPVGTFFDVLLLVCTSCGTGFYQDTEAQLSCKACPAHTSTPSVHARTLEECKDLCGLGTYSSDGLETCITCPLHTFTDMRGATECSPCPEETGTAVRGATSEEQCGRLCTEGFASISGIEPCYPCPADTYQFKQGENFCYECPQNTGMTVRGSSSYVGCIGIERLLPLLDDPNGADRSSALLGDEDVLDLFINSTRKFTDCFKDPCENGGACEPSGAGYICTCVPGYTGVNCETDINECEPNPCFNEATCTDQTNQFNCTCVAGYEGDRCETEINECDVIPCQNDATCVDELAGFTCVCLPGYTGDICETDINECNSKPCENGGMCLDLEARFECVCEPGYTGTTCDVDIDECQSNPCTNGGTCVDGINQLTCQCPVGFEGDLCEVNIDDCVGHLCEHGGSCEDQVNSYRCICAPTFSGQYCDTELLPHFDLSFTKPNTYHHVNMRDGISNMTEVTVAFYMKSNNTDTEGTPFSYGVGKGLLADVLTLTNLNALTLYVNGEAVVTDSRKLNDGVWYHVVVTWLSEGGEWKIYLNRILEVGGEGLQAGTVIPGGGVLVIGQEQDCLGGCFSSAQEFIGEITQFNLYDYAMTSEQVTQLFANCVSNTGTVKAWPDALGGIVGQVAVRRPPTFCNPCPTIVPGDNMMVTATNSYTNWLSCDSGFKLRIRVDGGSKGLSGRAMLKCGNRGTWSYRRKVREDPSAVFYCFRLPCRRYRDILHGNTDATGHLFNDTVTYSCNEGYLLSGRDVITCQADQTWSSAPPICVDIDECHDNPCHEMATCANSHGSFSCVCNYRYTGDGFTCTEINCGSPGIFPHGEISGMNFTFGGIVDFSCLIGYNLTGPRQRTCQENSDWSEYNPRCDIIECSDPEPVENARITKPQTTYLSEMSYTCNRGYEMVGQPTRVCLETTFWSGDPPTCNAVKCPEPNQLANAIVIRSRSRQYQFNDEIQYMCEAGYRLVGDAGFTCNENGTWDGVEPECQPMSCGRPLEIDNGQFEGTSFVYQSSVVYFCAIGYEMLGEEVLTCLETATWSGPSPRCDPVPCPTFGPIKNGRTEYTGLLYQDTITYICDEGYYLVGPETLTCLYNGAWGVLELDSEADLPLCLPVPCEEPSQVDNAFYVLNDGDDFVYGGNVKYFCDNGYLPAGQDTIFCLSDKMWNISSNPFQCDPAPCPMLAPLENGRIESESAVVEGEPYTFGQSVQYGCDAGFNLVGSDGSTCQATGTWSDSAPVCDPVHCGIPPDVNNATMSLADGPHKPGHHFQSELTYECHEGYRLTESSVGTRICDSDASWTGSSPVCERVPCGVPPEIDHASVSPTDPMVYQDRTNYACDIGFETSDSLNVECTSTGDFSAVPTCTPVSCGAPPFVEYSSTQHTFTHARLSFESRVSYTCDPDFEMVGEPEIECLETGEWSPVAPRCLPITCRDPGEVTNGFTVITTTNDMAHPDLYGVNAHPPRAAAIYVCNDGYEIPETVETLFTESNLPPIAIEVMNNNMQRDDLTDAQTTKLSVAMEVYETTLPHSPPAPDSPPSRRSVPLVIRRCSNTGAWRAAAPGCQPMLCSLPPEPPNSEITSSPPIGDDFEYLDRVAYACLPGHYFMEPTNMEVQCVWDASSSSVVWTHAPECAPVPCPPPLVPEHATFLAPDKADGETYVYKDTIVFFCNSGYEYPPLEDESLHAVISNVLQCTEEGEWSHEPAICVPVECPSFPPLPNTLMNMSSVTYLSIISFRCIPGHELHGAQEISCLATADWSDTLPTCDPVVCGPPPVIQHAVMERTTEVFGGITVYICDPGFSLNGSELLECLEAAEWIPDAPQCNRVPCLFPAAEDHVTYDVNFIPDQENIVGLSDEEILARTFVYETVISYSCDIGYETFDANPLQSVCQDTSTWSRDSPVCEIKDCGISPPPDTNGNANGDTTTYQSQLEYTCNDGYYMMAPSIVITCTAAGNWSSTSIPPCLPVSCGPPEDIDNGQHTGKAFVFPNTVNYTCDLGYELHGPSMLTCEATGDWSDYAPLCPPVECGSLPEISNGVLNVTTTHFGSVASYTCLDGYEMFSTGVLECLWDGFWDVGPPECPPVDCGWIGDLPNGVVLGDGQVFKSTVHFLCDPGHDLFGEVNSTCLSTATWSNPTPDCLPVDCGTPPIVSDATFDWDGLTSIFRTAVAYTCDPGYQLLSGSLGSVECLADGLWSPEPTCVRVRCPDPLIPEHGEAAGPYKAYYEYEDAVLYHCDKGYPPNGPTVSSCTASRNWSNPPPLCEPVDCGRLPDIAHGSKTGNSTLFMSIVVYDCDEGYKPIGDVTLQCSYTGLWKKEAPSCAPVSCGSPPTIRYGNFTGGNNPMLQLFLDTVEYDCSPGYYMSGPTTARCAADRMWKYEGDDGPGGPTENRRPICRRVMCQDPPTIDNGAYGLRNYSYDNVVTYTCDEGYEMVRLSPEGLRCAANKGDVQGYYDGLPPACTAVSCGLPTTIDNGIFVTTGTTFQKTGKYTCHEGHFPIGTVDIVCQSSRSWSGEPTCNPHDCGLPPVVDNAQLNVTSTVFPTVLHYNCDAGYDRRGPGTVECLSSANWSDISDTFCEPVPCGLIPFVANASYTATGYVYLDTIIYQCDEGFQLVPSNASGLTTLHCQSSGEWDEVTFACTPKSCGSAPYIHHGTKEMGSISWIYSNLEGVYYPDSVQYSCEPGYEMVGNAQLDCLSNEEFSSPAPSCPPVVCGNPDEIPNSALMYSGVTFGHNTTYTCNIGHVIRKEGQEFKTHMSICDADTNWSPSAPIEGCERIDCPPPSIIEHGELSVDEGASVPEYKYTDSATYVCDPGYEADPDTLTIMCQADKSWSGIPTCHPVDCGEPNCPELASCTRTGTTFMHETTAVCDPGYEFTTYAISYTVSCAEDSQWNEPSFNRSEVDTSTCRRHSCGQPEDIIHGSFVLNEGRITYDASVTYVCDVGHEMSADAIEVLSCLTDKTWGPTPPPICKPKDCGAVVCPDKATCVSDGTLFRSTFHVACHDGHEISYDVFEATLECLDSGNWSTLPSGILECLPVRCLSPTTVLYGTVISGNANEQPEFQSNVTYECDSGYLMRGEPVLTCQADRSYSTAPPRCYPVSCGDPSLIEHGGVDFIGITFLNKATYTCFPGYNLVGDKKWRCSAGGMWISTSTDDTVVPVASRTRRFADEHMQSGSGDMDQLPGLLTSRSLVMANIQEAGRVYCDPVPCGPAPRLTNGIQVNSSTTFVFPLSVSYICDDGFNLIGASSLKCQEDGTFGPDPVPVCQRQSCGPPPEPDNTHSSAVSVSGGAAHNVFEDQVTYTCNRGYEFTSSDPVNELICASDGTWTPLHPDACPPVSCGKPPPSNHAVVSGDVYTYNSVVTYSCEDGYDLVGLPELTCLSNEQWSPDHPPTCSPVSCPQPARIVHGSFTGEITYTKIVTYSCDVGYELDVNIPAGESETMTCRADRSWDSSPPRCKPVSCGEPSDITHGKYLGSDFTYGREVTYLCDVGHEMEGEPTIICLSDQTWSSPLPECNPVTCDRPPHVAHSDYKVGPSVTYGNTVTYQCLSGYDLIGADTLTCTASRTYDFAPPVCVPVSCGEPELSLNGHVASSSGAVTYQHNVTYMCDDGYEMPSGKLSQTVTCTADRVWSEPPAVCNPVVCGPPSATDNGYVEAPSDTFMSLASYACNPGYEIHSDGIAENCPENRACLVCQANRVWGISDNIESGTPQCLPLSCGEPPEVTHGKATVDTLTFLSEVAYSCDVGRELHPSTTTSLLCQADYKWGPVPPPFCRRIACPAPSDILDGTHVLLNTEYADADWRDNEGRRFLYEDAVIYECNEGYRFTNRISGDVGLLTCLDNGQWDKNAPTCEPVPCGPPPPRQHGTVLSEYINSSFVFMDTVAYQCSAGYEWTGAPSDEMLACMANGRWTQEQPPACEPVSCGGEPDVFNGLVTEVEGGVPGRRTYGSTIHYECFDGYDMIGQGVITCDWNRLWLPTPPECNPVSCSVVPVVSHGRPIHHSASSTTNVHFRSNFNVLAMDDYVPSGEPIPTALSSVPPSTVPPTNEPLPPDAHMYYVSRVSRSVSTGEQATDLTVPVYVYQDSISYECDSGYRLNSSLPASLRCGADGQWSRPRPMCEPVPCEPLPQIPNAKRIGDIFEYGQQVAYACDQGYETSEDVITDFGCSASGQFQPLKSNQDAALQLPTCNRVSCGPSLNVTHAEIFGTSKSSENLYQDEIRYACTPGYNLRGEAILVCQGNKVYDYPPPDCEPVSCGEPIILLHATRIETGVTFQNTTTYTCDEGYVDNTDTITCQADGRWSPTSLTCEKVDCGFPPMLDHGLIDINGTKYGDVALYACQPGYIETGSLQRTCLATGNWSYACQECKPVDCGTPTDPRNGTHIAQGNYTFGNVILYNCNEGYFLDGDMFSMCNEFGEWHGTVPECHRVPCGIPPLVEHATEPSENLLFGDQFVYQCTFGHVMTGEDTLECTSDGTFSALPPSCPPIKCGEPPRVANAHLVSSGTYVYGNFSWYECDPGHEFLFSPFSVICTGFGIFQDVTDFGCEPVWCPSLSDIEHGTPSQYEGVYSESVTYNCDNGYQLVGTKVTTCNENAEWSHPPPLCPPVECGLAPTFPNSAVVDQRIFTFDMTVTYECNEGYEFPPINGEEDIRCDADATFTPGDVTCKPVSCPELHPLLHGQVKLDDITYQSEGTIVCQDGYQLNTGEEQVDFICQANRMWTRDVNSLSCDPVPCDSLPVVEYSSMDVADTYEPSNINGINTPTDDHLTLYYGASVTYTCNPGYYIEELPDLSCLTDGSWSSPPPSCFPVRCGEAPDVPNSLVFNMTYTYGMEAHYDCQTGHNSEDPLMYRTCQADGSFSENAITCDRIPCPAPPEVEHGSASRTSAAYNDLVVYECDDGYELDGNGTIRCGSLGQYASSVPSCPPVQCNELPVIPYSNLWLSGSHFEDEGILECVRGFQLNRDDDQISLVCQADRSWSSDLSDIRCDPVNCERLEGIANGAVTVIPPIRRTDYHPDVTTRTSHTYLTRLTFTCDSGYTLSGADSITCEADRLWNEPPPRCDPVSCHNPPSIDNAILTTEEHTFGQSAVYECIDGYVLSSNGNFRNCNANGLFTNHDVTCSPRPCPSPPVIKHGRVDAPSGRGSVFGDIVNTLCDDGYYLVGSGLLECLATGQWSDVESTCEPVPCGVALTVTNAMPTNDALFEYSYGDTVTYECDQGYVLRGTNNTIACGPDGLFEDTPVACDPVLCGEIPDIIQATTSGTGTSYGRVMVITCDPGYEISSSGKTELSVTCQHNGEWTEDPNMIRCEGILCESLEPLTYGRLELPATDQVILDVPNPTKTVLNYPGTVVYRCDRGYTLLGRSKRNCLTDGSWAGEKPHCLPVDCGSLPRLIHGTISGSKTTISGSIADYKCDVGYQLEPPGATQRQCEETGSWSGVPPFCTLVSCGAHPEIEHATFSSDGVIYYGSSVAINCVKGYELIGNATRVCGADGSFEGTDPICERISCNFHPSLVNGVVKPQYALYYQESVNITCEEGFKLENGDAYRVCQIDRTWSGKLPECAPEPTPAALFYDPGFGGFSMPCEMPPVVGKHIKLVDDEVLLDYYDDGAVLEFCCSRGYLPRGDLTVRCESGYWSTIPECLPRCKHRCLHSGVCSSRGHCSCQNGWSGSRCHRPVCSLPCLNGGYCTAPFQCACASGWTGSRCQTAVCEPPCLNGGDCFAPNQCNCPYGYQGNDCSESSFFGLW